MCRGHHEEGSYLYIYIYIYVATCREYDWLKFTTEAIFISATCLGMPHFGQTFKLCMVIQCCMSYNNYNHTTDNAWHHLTTWDACVHVCDLLLTFSLTWIHWKVLAYTSPTYLPDIYLIDNLYIVYDWLLFCHSCHFSWTCSYTDCCWITLVQAGGSAGWEIRVKGDLTPRADNGKINSSPTTAVSPIFRLRHGGTHIINIPGKEL